MYKSGFVSIVGRPNVGKSTLLNHILKTKLVITLPTAQTTRNTVQGIYTDEDSQNHLSRYTQVFINLKMD